MKNEKDLSKIIDFILEKYHNPLRENLTKISILLDKIVEVHWTQHPEFAKIRAIFSNFKLDILSHIDKEEKILFPIMKEIEESFKNRKKLWCFHCASVGNPIRQMELEHSNFENYLNDMRTLSNNYLIPSDACNAVTNTYNMLKELDSETTDHAALENNTLHKLRIQKETLTKLN